MTLSWYAIRSKPRKEEALWGQLLAREFETFYPRLRVHPVNPRARKVAPYFPGYMFVKGDLREIGPSTFNYMPFSAGLVSFGGEPAPVSETFIRDLTRRLHEIVDAGGMLFDGLNTGDPVRIREGPFEGFEALFDARLSGKDRVRVLLQMLSDRMVPVELAANWIEKASVQPSAGSYPH